MILLCTQSVDPCLETTYTEADSQVARPLFQELQFNDPQQAFQVCYGIFSATVLFDTSVGKNLS